MASGYIALNDLKVLCKGKVKFKTCRVTFRHDLKNPPSDKTLKLSELVNPLLSIHKTEVICFADGIMEKIIKEYEPIEQEPIYKNLNTEEIADKKEEAEISFEKDKINWVNRAVCDNERIKIAVHEGYDCNDEYIRERLKKEWPGFTICDEHTFYWKLDCPTLPALKTEQRLKKQINGFKDKYGTYVRCCKLEAYDGTEFNEEAIILCNFYGKYEVIGLLNYLSEIYGETTNFLD
jgi:hypothetical protein